MNTEKKIVNRLHHSRPQLELMCILMCYKATKPLVAAGLKPGFHIVVSVVSVVRKKFIGQI